MAKAGKRCYLAAMTTIEPASERKECVALRADTPFTGKQGLTYKAGISAETVGAKGIHLELLTIPPGGRAKPHLHRSHETAIYMISGEAMTYYGDRLEKTILLRAGEFMYIPPDVPHMPHNQSETTPCVAVVARTDPNEQESVELLPELDPPG